MASRRNKSKEQGQALNYQQQLLSIFDYIDGDDPEELYDRLESITYRDVLVWARQQDTATWIAALMYMQHIQAYIG